MAGAPPVECETNDDCDNGDPCDGQEICEDGSCAAGSGACTNPDPDACECVPNGDDCVVVPRDDDHDNYGNAACPAGNGTDCDDTDPDVNPDQAETCNGIDDDCNGLGDIQDGLTVAGVDPVPGPSGVDKLGSSTMYNQVFIDWADDAFYVLWGPYQQGVRMVRVAADGTPDGGSVDLAAEQSPNGSIYGGVLAAAVGTNAAYIYNHGASGSESYSLAVFGRGGLPIQETSISGGTGLVDADLVVFQGMFVAGILTDFGTPTVRVRAFNEEGGHLSQQDREFPDAARVRVGAGATTLGVLSVPDTAGGNLDLVVLDDQLTLQRVVNVGRGDGVVGGRADQLGVVSSVDGAITLQVYDGVGDPVCSTELDTAEVPWELLGQGDHWLVITKDDGLEANSAVLTLSDDCRLVDRASVLTSIRFSTMDDNVHMAAGPSSLGFAWLSAYTPTSYDVYGRFYGAPLCAAAGG